MKKNKHSKEDDIDLLIHRYPNLRDPYITNIILNRAEEFSFYSVSIKSDSF